MRTLGFIRSVNLKFRPDGIQIEAKDFVNNAVSQTLDFSNPIQAWSKRVLAKARNQGVEIELKMKKSTQPEPFCVISNQWLFTTEAKTRILQEHVKVEQKLNFNLWQLQDSWMAIANSRPIFDKFILQV